MELHLPSLIVSRRQRDERSLKEKYPEEEATTGRSTANHDAVIAIDLQSAIRRNKQLKQVIKLILKLLRVLYFPLFSPWCRTWTSQRRYSGQGSRIVRWRRFWSAPNKIIYANLPSHQSNLNFTLISRNIQVNADCYDCSIEMP